MAIYQYTKKRVALQLLHFGLHWMPVAEIRDYEEIPLSPQKDTPKMHHPHFYALIDSFFYQDCRRNPYKNADMLP